MRRSPLALSAGAQRRSRRAPRSTLLLALLLVSATASAQAPPVAPRPPPTPPATDASTPQTDIGRLYREFREVKERLPFTLAAGTWIYLYLPVDGNAAVPSGVLDPYFYNWAFFLF